MKYIYLSVYSIVLSGCSMAGPFISNISSGSNGILSIEKCSLFINHRYNIAVASNYDCHTNSIQIPLQQKSSNHAGNSHLN